MFPALALSKSGNAGRSLNDFLSACSTSSPVCIFIIGAISISVKANGINKTSERLIRQEADLNRRDSARTEWIAGVSHDIRTPLSLVMGYASQLEEDDNLPPEAREKAAVIRSQSERIKSLVSDLNLASKLEYAM